MHAIWIILTKDRKGYSGHPETLYWKGKLKSPYNRHEKLVIEMERRGFRHASPLDPKLALGKSVHDESVDQVSMQMDILRKEGCGCKV